jgi:hypothetical protein
MKHTVEMSSGAMIYIPSFIKIGSGIQKLMRDDSQTQRLIATSISHKPTLKLSEYGDYNENGDETSAFM